MNELRRAIYRVEIAQDYVEKCCADVWREFERIDPELAKEVEKLGLTEQGTAEWICQNSFEGELSPAEFLLRGQRDRVIEKIRTSSGAMLSEVESQHFLKELDLPFRPNAMLAEALLNSTKPKKTLDQVHIAYCEYFATGEGVSVFIALGGSYSHAESVFKKHVPDYYHVGLIVHPLVLPRNGGEQIIGLLPQPLLDLFSTNPDGTTEYFSTVHYNLS